MKLLATVLLMGFPWFLWGQPDHADFGTTQISKMEAERWSPNLKKSFGSYNGDNYQWNYAECYWEVNPLDRYITGRVVHHIAIDNDAGDTISFDFNEALSVNSASIDGEPVPYFFFDAFSLGLDIGDVNISENSVVEITYEGEPNNSNLMSFNQAVRTINGENLFEIYTLSQPYGARDWWPCKQTLRDKLDSIFIEITVPEGFRAGSNGKLEYEDENPEGTIGFGWKHRYPIPAYLISMAVAEYDSFSQFVEVGGSEIEILNYIYPERLALEQKRAQDIPEMMVLFSELFGIYPYADEKYGHAQTAIPGGMEHTTMSTMSNLNFNLSAHELAHQWFGNKITCGSWEDIWLNEGFATYINGLAIEFLRDEDAFRTFKEGLRGNILAQPDGSVFVNDTTSRSRIFNGRLSYNKGAYLLHMLRWELGDDVFFEACRNFINDPELEFDYVYTNDFISHLESASGRDLNYFFDDWYYGEGHPQYKVEWNRTSNGVGLEIEQTPSHQSVDFFEMHLPVKLIGSGNEVTVVLNHQFSGQRFLLTPGFQVEQIQFDPDLWILSENTVVFNPSTNFGSDEILVLPNPVSGVVKFTLLNPAQFAQYAEILNTQGKVVMTYNPAGPIRDSFEMDVSRLAVGTYIIRLINEDSSTSTRFVVARN
ncbi:MAG: M1 family aminopeptidase [Cryomorphaceae bacterium]|nr:T9SS type A sorting domain-containing protein [Flavobacteriales bacterium]